MSSPRRHESLWETLRQSAPHLGAAIRNMRPTWHVESLRSVTAEFLDQHEIRTVIWDADGTLTAYHAAQLDPEIEPAFRALLASPRIQHLMISNSPEWRFAALGKLLPSVRIIRVYVCNNVVHTRSLYLGVDSMTTETRAALLAAGAHALRKPHRALMECALAQVDGEPAHAVMIGDQYLTDVAGAGMTGVRSIKVAPLAPSSFPLAVRLAQKGETLLYALLQGRATRLK